MWSTELREDSGCFCLGTWLCFFFILYLNVGTFSSGWSFQGSFPFGFGARGFLLYFFLLFTTCLQLIHVLREMSDVKAGYVTNPPLSATLPRASGSILYLPAVQPQQVAAVDTACSGRVITSCKSDFAGSHPITKSLEVTFQQLSLALYTRCFTYLKVTEVTVICFHKLPLIHVLQEMKSEAGTSALSTT